jgi:hypothetical protein
VISSEVNRRGNCFRKLSGNRESSLQTREAMKLLLDDWLAEGKGGYLEVSLSLHLRRLSDIPRA